MVMLKHPDEFFEAGQSWLFLAELAFEDHNMDRAADLALLAIASALMGMCAQFTDTDPDRGEPEDD